MANWSKNKTVPSAINDGKEFTTKDNLAINELNAIVNNSFYASEISETSIAKADSAVATSKLAEDKIDNFIKTEGNSVVTLNGVPQVTWSADFAESERQKSKNLLPFPFVVLSSTNNGITFTVNSDQSITMNGTIADNSKNSSMALAYNLLVDAGTYTISTNKSIDDDNLNVVIYDGINYHGSNSTVTFTEPKSLFIYAQVSKLSTTTLTNVNMKVMLCKGTDTEWQPYNGAIVHEKDIADVEHKKIIYDSNLQPTPLGNNTDYSNGINISSEGIWYPMNLTDLKRIMISATYNKEQQINAFIDLENLGGNTSYSSRGCFGKDGVYLGEVGVAVHKDKQKIYVFSTVDTIIYRIIGWY